MSAPGWGGTSVYTGMGRDQCGEEPVSTPERDQCLRQSSTWGGTSVYSGMGRDQCGEGPGEGPVSTPEWGGTRVYAAAVAVDLYAALYRFQWESLPHSLPFFSTPRRYLRSIASISMGVVYVPTEGCTYPWSAQRRRCHSAPSPSAARLSPTPQPSASPTNLPLFAQPDLTLPIPSLRSSLASPLNRDATCRARAH